MFDFYCDVKKAIPGDMPSPRGHVMSTHCFVDANNRGNLVTRRSQTGILIFCNRAPIIWYSKRQNTVKVSTFGSELVAMKNAMELIEALHYKLRRVTKEDTATNLSDLFTKILPIVVRDRLLDLFT